MIRKLATALCLAAGLSGCATLSDGTQQTTFDQVQAITIQACAFVPTIATVASIVAVGNPAVASASAIATAICEAVTQSSPTLSRRRAAVAPSVLGVPVQGHFVEVRGYRVR